MVKKKILVLSVSAGYGHVIAAESLVSAAERYFPDTIDIVHTDVLSLMPFNMNFTYKYGYNFVAKYCPVVWKMAYKYTDHAGNDNFFTRFRKKIELFSSKKLLQHINDIVPDQIICTHFMPAQLLKSWHEQNLINCGRWVVITDYITHRFWHVKGQTGYFSPTLENKEHMYARGLSGERIEVTGIPVMPKFSDKMPREMSGRKFGIETTKTTLLLMGGAAGVGGLKKTAEKILSIPGDFQLIVLTGRNKRLYSTLKEYAAATGGRLIPLSFTKDVDHLFNISDLVLTKPGGLTVSECIATGKAMIVFSPIPGQEESNAEYLTNHEVALRAHNADELIEMVAKLLNEPETLKKMAENSCCIGRPYAAKDILGFMPV